MRKLLLAFSFVAALGSSALANWTGKNAAGTTITFFNSVDCTSVVCIPIAQLTDGTGAAIGVAGSPLFFKWTDGTNPVGVAPANTAPTAAQPSGVVTLSPNTGEVGAPATGVTQPAGGVGLSGWLSGIYNTLKVGLFLQSPTVTNGSLVKGTTAAMTGTTSTQVIAAVTSQHIYVMAIHCNNTGAAATLVSIQDGSGGTTLDTLICPAGGGDERNGGGTPLFWTTAGNGLFAADVTTGESVIVQASGYSSAN